MIDAPQILHSATYAEGTKGLYGDRSEGG
jgi:hypothetical protein